MKSLKNWTLLTFVLVWIPSLLGGLPGIPRALGTPRNFLYLSLILFLGSLFRKTFRQQLQGVFEGQSDDLSNEKFSFWKKQVLFWGLFLYLKLMIVNTYTFQIIDVDFSYFDLMISNFIRGKGWFSEACDCNHMGVHSTYYFYPIAVLHRIFNSPLVLQIIHGLSMWIAAFPLLKLFHHFKLRRDLSVALLFSFLNYTAFIHVLKYNFHFEVWYIPILLWMFYHFEKENWKLMHLCAFLCLLVKEDAGFYLLGFAGGMFWLKRKLLHPALLASYSIVITIFSLKVFIPHFRETSDYVVAGTASIYGRNMKEIVLNMAGDPLGLFFYVLKGKWWSFLIPFSFLPLLSPAFLLSVAPFVLIHSTAKSPLMFSISLYYSAPFTPFIVYFYFKALDNLKNFRWNKLKGLAPKKSYFFIVFMIYGVFVGSGQIRIAEVKPQYWKFKSHLNSIIKGGEEICAQGSIIPHVGYDSKPTPLKWCKDSVLYDWVLLNSKINAYPFSHPKTEEYIEKFKKDSRYKVDKQIGDFYLFSPL